MNYMLYCSKLFLIYFKRLQTIRWDLVRNTKVTDRKAYLNQKVSEQSSNVEMSTINELKAEITFLVGEIKLKMI